MEQDSHDTDLQFLRVTVRQVAATLRLELHELAGDALVTLVLETRQAAGAQASSVDVCR